MCPCLAECFSRVPAHLAPLGGSRRPSFPTSLPCCRPSDFIYYVDPSNKVFYNTAHHRYSQFIPTIRDHIQFARIHTTHRNPHHGRKRASRQTWSRRPVCSVQAGVTRYDMRYSRKACDVAMLTFLQVNQPLERYRPVHVRGIQLLTQPNQSSLVLRFVKDQFDDYRESTIGAAFLTQTVALDENTTVKFEIWDTAGQERYKSLAPMYYRNAHCAVVVYDITHAVCATVPHTDT